MLDGGEQMTKIIKNIIIIFAITLIGVWIVLKIPFATDINQIITAKKYENGSAVQETVVNIDGTRSNYLFADEQNFNGQFYIDYCERTGREDMYANITWRKNREMQHMLYYQNATFPSINEEINYYIMINKKMNEFAIGFVDGTIIATSDEIYQNYIKKINPTK